MRTRRPAQRIDTNPENYVRVASLEELRRLPETTTKARVAEPIGYVGVDIIMDRQSVSIIGDQAGLSLKEGEKSTLFVRHNRGNGWTAQVLSLESEDFSESIYGFTKISRRATVDPEVVVGFGSKVPAYAKIHFDIDNKVRIARLADVTLAYVTAQREVRLKPLKLIPLVASSFVFSAGTRPILDSIIHNPPWLATFGLGVASGMAGAVAYLFAKRSDAAFLMKVHRKMKEQARTAKRT